MKDRCRESRSRSERAERRGWFIFWPLSSLRKVCPYYCWHTGFVIDEPQQLVSHRSRSSQHEPKREKSHFTACWPYLSTVFTLGHVSILHVLIIVDKSPCRGNQICISANKKPGGRSNERTADYATRNHFMIVSCPNPSAISGCPWAPFGSK